MVIWKNTSMRFANLTAGNDYTLASQRERGRERETYRWERRNQEAQKTQEQGIYIFTSSSANAISPPQMKCLTIPLP
jgi:hypothetical protein